MVTGRLNIVVAEIPGWDNRWIDTSNFRMQRTVARFARYGR
jgi:hypothetical protein